MSIELGGRRAVVTGGNRGIGLATARKLAEYGAHVTITARDEAKLDAALEEIGDAGAVQGRAVDATDRAAVSALMAEGRFDVLVNNAGVLSPIGHIGDLAIDAWAALVETNVVGAFHAAQEAIRNRSETGLTIVNLSSGAARGAMEGWSAYCTSKAGLAMMTRCIHGELGGQGVRVFGFAPGVVDTDMQGSIRQSGINPVSRLKREDLAPPDEPAHAIAWLCTAEADALKGEEVDVRDEAFRRQCGLPA